MTNGQAPPPDSNLPPMETDSQRLLQNGAPDSNGAPKMDLPDFSRPPPMFDPSRPPPQMMGSQPGFFIHRWLKTISILGQQPTGQFNPPLNSNMTSVVSAIDPIQFNVPPPTASFRV